MHPYALTETQKDLICLLVACDHEDKLPTKGFVGLIGANDKFSLLIPEHFLEVESLTDFEALCEMGLLRKERGGWNPFYQITEAAHEFVKRMFDLSSSLLTDLEATLPEPRGASFQGSDPDINSETSEIIHAREILSSTVYALTEKLLKELRPNLDEPTYETYHQAVQALQRQLLAKKPNLSTCKRLIRKISFLGDLNGSVEMMTKAWPYIHPLLVILNTRLSAPKPDKGGSP